MPLVFERNDGQSGAAVRFLSRLPGQQLYFTDNALTWVLSTPQPSRSQHEPATRASDPRHRAPAVADTGTGHIVRMTLLGARPDVTVTGGDRQETVAHYFRGTRPSEWLTDVPTFARIRYAGVYPGIDLEYYGRGGDIEYDFVVAPGADPSAIALQFHGATRLGLNEAGDLLIDTPAGRILQRKPIAYQAIAGERHPVESAYVLGPSGRVAIRVGEYDRRRSLVIDPVITYSTFLGGTGGTYGDQAYGIASDALDNVYVTGNAASTVFPAIGGASTSNDTFVVKLTPAGTLAYIAIVGGTLADSGEGIAVDSAGHVAVTGWTDSTNFPTLNPIRANQTGRDAFLFKLDPLGAMIFSTYLGGSGTFEYGESVALDVAGNAYVSGVTNSSDFPTLNALQPVGQGQDAFVVKVNPSGTLVYGTYLGGSGLEVAEGIAVDATGSVYVTGWTNSSGFPRVASTQVKQSGEDVFVSRYAADGGSFVYSRFLGGNSHERAFAITTDGAGGAYVAGRTDSTNFPALGALHGDRPGADGFLARLDASGAVTFSSYLGGSGWERVLGLSARDGRLFVAGVTYSADFPTLNALQPAKSGDGTTSDGFVVEIDVASHTALASTYLGGLGEDEARGVAALPGSNLVVAGWTQSSDFPTARAIQDFRSNVSNLFIARLAPLGIDSVTPAFVQAVGGEALTISGRLLAAGAGVLINDQPALGVTVIDPDTITAVTPALAPGLADVTIVNPDGGSATLYGALRVLDGTGPLADAGPDQTVEAIDASGAIVTLDASATFDPDHDPLTYEWRDANGTVIGSGALVTPVVPLGSHTFTLLASDGHSAPATDAVTISVVDTRPPAVTVLSPNGGNLVYAGTPTLLEWSASDAVSGVSSFDVYLSTDGGTTYGATPICAGVSGNARSCLWATPGPLTSKARIRVAARDGSGNVATDGSDATFKVLSGQAWIFVTAPNTALNWGAGSTQQIKWSHNLGAAAFVRLESSLDGGLSWSVIDAAVKNSASSSGSYYWTLPAALSPNARVRVSWNNGPVSDTSDVNFQIAQAYIALTTPKATANWGFGTSQTQTWTTNLGPQDRVSVFISSDGGTTFTEEVAAQVVATNRKAWFTTPVLGGATTTARLRVAWVNAPAGLAAEGTNPANFRIEPPFVTLTSPGAGAVWTVGSSQTIKWFHNLGTLENVLIELSQDDGATYPIVILPSTVSDGAQTVAISGAWATTQGRLRLSWVRDAQVSDTSDTPIVIQ